MKILFLHPNFPAQFKNVVKHFADIGHECLFLCQTHHGRSIANVERLCLKGDLGDIFLQDNSNSIFDKTQIRASQYKRAFSMLNDRNWNPDIVISHTGWGCGIHVREFWPEVKIISYLEWWYDSKSPFFEGLKHNPYLNFSKASISKFYLRNQPIALELLNSDIIVTPTRFQLVQLPTLLQTHTKVIFDGVDLSLFCPGIKHPLPKITYGTRGMEPLRGFPQFIKEIPKIIAKCPEVIIEIAGSDEAFYFVNYPRGFSSWKDWAIDYLAQFNVSTSVVWKGVMNLVDYSNWLKQSWVHVYLSEPFIPSWSMIESIITCPNVILNDNSMTRDFALSDITEYVNFNEEGFLSDNSVFVAILKNKSELRSGSRIKSIYKEYSEKYSVDKSLIAWKKLLC